ncbi:MAG: LruC domain-containing protein, partial [Bacteroidales bacterium]
RNLYSDVSVVAGQWYHVAVVFEDKEMRRLYINGNLAGEDVRKVNYPGLNVFGLGRWSDKTPGDYFRGAISEVRFWNTSRTQQEIQADMETALTGNEPGLIGYWPCEEGSGNTAFDHSGQQNHLDLSPSTVWCEGMSGGDADGDGIPDEEDDYPDDPLRAFNNFWPAGFGTLVFEDLWPSIGDYDFNDLVLAYRFKTVTNASNHVVEAFGNFGVMATGAGLENGFGFSLPDMNIPSENIQVSGFIGNNGITTFEANGTEAGQTQVTMIVADMLPYVGNTRPDNPYVDPVNILLQVSVTGGEYTMADLGFETFNPFLIVNGNREHEIHLADYPPTDLADISLFGTLDDATNPPVAWYKSPDNLPWGLNFPEGFSYTREKDTIWQGHLKFIDWVNSNGQQYNDWYTNQPGYRNQDRIYVPD